MVDFVNLVLQEMQGDSTPSANTNVVMGANSPHMSLKISSNNSVHTQPKTSVKKYISKSKKKKNKYLFGESEGTALTPTEDASKVEPISPSDKNDEEIDPEELKKVNTFYRENLNNLKSVWDPKYTVKYNSPLPGDIEDLFTKVHYSVIRKVKDSSQYDMKHIYPLMDLIANLDEAKGNIADMKNWLNKFEENLKKSPGAPLDYTAIHPWIKTIRDDYFQKQAKENVGAMTLENPDLAQKAIMPVIMSLLAVRKKVRSHVVDFTQTPSSVPFVEDIIYNPQKYAGGGIQIPNDLQSLYDDVSAKSLMFIGKFAKDYFDSEVQRLDIELQDENSTYKTFLNNAKLKTETVLVNTDESLISFEDFFVKEGQRFGPENTGQTYKDGPKGVSVVPSKASNEKKPEKTKEIKTFDWEYFTNSDNPINPELEQLQGGYTVANLKKQADNDNGHAEALYDKLTEFANYIRTQPQRDLAGAMNALSKGLQGLIGTAGASLKF